MDAEILYVFGGQKHSYGDAIAALDAEAATLDPDRWEGGWNAHDYLIEAVNTGVIDLVFTGDDDS
ncbi:hypothetical protein C6A86_016980 [Mycobacterium sp. ITM-2016-00316]|uniref:hypothetical protein n=1 Tax=Mycobacterium sp. ITM-2016-00316 TaxID=2099695 RepID=UPI000CF84B27|nr:hypothetical protein [Mycobacterium sp. ITM-2016-00316]WNG79960.1 hypothetical protein C6A86_016980 [Mycobacterium sp. ITM-2016-00316]